MVARGLPARTINPAPWTTSDRSGSTPRQTNGYDCGVFTLVNMSLLAQGTNLNLSSYSQLTIYQRNTRSRIAHVILLHSEIPVPSQVIGGRPRQAVATLTPDPSTRCTAGVPPKATNAYRKQKRHDPQRLVVGGQRVTRVATYGDEPPENTSTLLNRKRTSLSIATASDQDATLQRLLPEQRTKRKGAEETPRMTKFQKK